MSEEIKKVSGGYPGYHDYITVNLGVKNGKVTECTVEGEGEYKDTLWGGKAMREMPEKIVEAGTLEVDAVTGATITSKAIINAGKIAMNKLSDESKEVKMKPGVYKASAKGFWGIWPLPVEITVNETSLLAISVPEKRQEHGETEVMLKAVKERLIPRMIKNQSIAVDAIAGCTATSNAVKQAVNEALREAIKAGGSEESAIEKFIQYPVREE